ncbi:N-acetyltransferase domain-containing protein [Flavobacterium longum]|uniref:GNAT family N-acetyltransferase n=1 Tax=Flavobacterium longum TaxID=1299340 RepID=UPI0039EA3157
MDVSIRPATLTDVPAILEIVNHAIVNSTAIYDEAARTLAQQLDWFQQKQLSGDPVLVAEFDGNVLGFATFGIFKPKVGYRYSVEHSVYVASEMTGKGIGRQLLTELIDIARKRNIHTMAGYIDSDNAGSIAFHEQFGFEKVGELKEIGFKFGRYLNVTLMQRFL